MFDAGFILAAETLEREECFQSRTKPDGDSLGSWIRVSEHAVPKITGSAQSRFHLGSRIHASLCGFNCTQECLARRFTASIFQRLRE